MNTPARALWSWSELCTALSRPAAEGPAVARIMTDSRLVEPGDLFVALAGDPGARFNPSKRSSVDGHAFVQDAATRGAVGAIVRQDWRGDGGGLPVIECTDTYDALWALGRAARRRLEAPAAAVTGSSGKTTAKTFFAAATAGYASPGSFNNHIGVPLSLANAPPDAPAAIFEIGTNHPGEIEPLARMVAPDAAIVLNVQSAHLEHFPGRDALRKEKISIFNGLSDKSNAVWHEDIGLDFGASYGVSGAAAGRLIDVLGDRARLSIDGRDLSARVPGGGRHRALTLTAVLLAMQRLQLDLAPGLELPHALVPAGRGRIHELRRLTVVDDSYNANPDSMEGAISAFYERSDAGLVVLGEMLELGPAGAEAHLALAKRVVEGPCKAILVGAGFEAAATALGLPWFAQADEALRISIDAALPPGGAVLFKGSNRVFWQVRFVERFIESHV